MPCKSGNQKSTEKTTVPATKPTQMEGSKIRPPMLKESALATKTTRIAPPARGLFKYSL